MIMSAILATIIGLMARRGAHSFQSSRFFGLVRRFELSSSILATTRLFGTTDTTFKGFKPHPIKPVDYSAVNSDGRSMLEVSTLNLKGLKDEVSRQRLRAFKKVGKANERLQKENHDLATLSAISNPSLEQLESCPDIEKTRAELQDLKQRLQRLTTLEENLLPIKNVKDGKLMELIPELQALQVSDTPPPQQERGLKKAKGVPPPPRKPYYTYMSFDNIEIRVGRGASDNDLLSCDPEYRDNDNWWMHVSGAAGSHIVIRNTDNDFPVKFRETIKDAALLAALNSKANGSGRVAVTLTRCRNVSKPRGTKPGLVYLSGDVITVNIDMKVERQRLDRLKKVDQTNARVNADISK